MKIQVELDENRIIGLLSLAASKDSFLVDCNLNKSDIRRICQETVTEYGLQYDGWGDYLTDAEQGGINGWAIAQVKRYKF